MAPSALAVAVEVDPKTVERWLDSGRVPHQRHRQNTARVLGADETYLWPQLLDDARARTASQAEVRSVFPHRGAVPSDLWRKLIDDAKENVDALVYAGLFLVNSHLDLPARLAARAGDGLNARLLYGDPESDTVA